MSHKIVWAKWKDPLEVLLQESPSMDDHDRDPDWHEDEDEIATDSFGHSKPIKPGHYMNTPQGIMALNEHSLPGRLFNFWVAHTNFDITKRVVDAVEKVAGVELLEALTRYRLRVGIGRVFDEDEVKGAIDNTILAAISSPVPTQATGVYWANIQTKEGRWDMACGTSIADVEQKLARFDSPQQIVRSWKKE